VKTYLDNLRPLEKRVVVGVAVMAFVVFNLWFVVPHFSDWEQAGFRREKAEAKLAQYLADIAQTKNYNAQIRQLSSDAYEVPAEEQSLHFATEVQRKAAVCGMVLGSISRVSERTNNPFFLEKSITVTATAKEQQLVDFLYDLGSSNSMIRVRDLGLRPDAPRQQLNAQIKLVASYQKAPSAKAAGQPSKPSAPAPTTAPLASKRPNPSPKRP
jgi:Tfp pilus assembly protein PilO